MVKINPFDRYGRFATFLELKKGKDCKIAMLEFSPVSSLKSFSLLFFFENENTQYELKGNGLNIFETNQ